MNAAGPAGSAQDVSLPEGCASADTNDIVGALTRRLQNLRVQTSAKRASKEAIAVQRATVRSSQEELARRIEVLSAELRQHQEKAEMEAMAAAEAEVDRRLLPFIEAESKPFKEAREQKDALLEELCVDEQKLVQKQAEVETLRAEFLQDIARLQNVDTAAATVLAQWHRACQEAESLQLTRHRDSQHLAQTWEKLLAADVDLSRVAKVRGTMSGASKFVFPSDTSEYRRSWTDFNPSAAEAGLRRAENTDTLGLDFLAHASDWKHLEHVCTECARTPSMTTMVVLECAAGILEAASNRLTAAKAFVEGEAQPEEVRRIFAREDTINRMQVLSSGSAATLAAVASLKPAVEARLAAATITLERAFRTSASTAALLRWCQMALAAHSKLFPTLVQS